MSVRVRFAPSPTGMLHVGALRTALYCHLFARKHHGTNILRLEDTDRTRFNPDSVDEFVSTLRWVGIEFDEGPHTGGGYGPYFQSERKEAGLYQPWVDKLLEEGHAYRAFETPEELDEMRTFQQVNKMPTGYFGGDWRDASPEKVAEAIAEGKPSVVRLRIPRNTTIRGMDGIRGRLEWDSNTVDDAVLIKGDGMPTYHMAAICDDHMMEISHVFRGDEWLSSFPKHIILYEALKLNMPQYVHCAVITGDDGKKLSKRHGATRVLDYMAMGIMPNPLKNFIALIGWAPAEDREILEPEQMVQLFDIKGLQPSPGRFDFKKLLWMNGMAIRAMTPSAVLDAIIALTDEPHALQYWSEDDEELGKKDAQATFASLQALVTRATTDRGFVESMIALTQDRTTTLVEFGPMCAFFLSDQVEFDQAAADKWFGQPHVRPLFTSLRDAMAGKEAVSVEECEKLVKDWAAENGLEKLGPAVHPVRVALTGRTVGPGLFELMSALGPERMAARFGAALERLP